VFVPAIGQWGYEDENGTWNGVIGMVNRGEVDVGVCDVAMHSRRVAVISYSMQVATFQYVLNLLVCAVRLSSNVQIILECFWVLDRRISRNRLTLQKDHHVSKTREVRSCKTFNSKVSANGTRRAFHTKTGSGAVCILRLFWSKFRKRMASCRHQIQNLHLYFL
jgi:hypothetical protein